MKKYNSADLIRGLKTKHIYGLFRRNISLPHKEDITSFYRTYFFNGILNKQISSYHFFNLPFSWSYSKEGYLFWLRMYRETLNIIRKHETSIHKKNKRF